MLVLLADPRAGQGRPKTLAALSSFLYFSEKAIYSMHEKLMDQ